MKTLLVTLMVILILAACAPEPEPTLLVNSPTVVEVPTLTPTIEAVPALSYPAVVYTDSTDRISFQHPSDWTIVPEEVIGSRGSQTVLLSPGSTIEALADGGSRIVLLRYQWDPKDDLSAWEAQRKLAWEASGFTILEESTRELEDGRPVVDLRMKTPDGTEMVLSLTTIGGLYMELNGTGNLELCREILGTLASAQ